MRESGILMPVSSLPGPYGIGCFGTEAETFVDFLAAAGQKIWQILPLSPTGYGDSPYQSCSAFAGNPYFIDLDALKAEGLLTAAQLKAESWGEDPLQVDYGTLYTSRYKILRAAYAAWRRQCEGLHGCAHYYPDAYYAFTLENESWLEDYALYMALKTANQMKSWTEWPRAYRMRDGHALAAFRAEHEEEIEGQVRIVSIPGADVCACCGTHTAATGAVGQIKILAAENYKGGVRLSIVCGERALLAAQAMRQRQAEIGALLSAKPSETAHAVHRVFDEYTALKFAHFGLCSQLFEALAAQTAPGEDAIRIVPGLDPDGLHRLAVKLSAATTGLCAALTANEKGTGYCLARADGDVRSLTKALNAALNGRGGGKPGICQGSCAAAPEQVERFLKENHIL
jgi:hypothetical protein